MKNTLGRSFTTWFERRNRNASPSDLEAAFRAGWRASEKNSSPTKVPGRKKLMNKNVFQVEIERLQGLSDACEKVRASLTEDQLAKLKERWEEADEVWKVQEDMTNFDAFLAKCFVDEAVEDKDVNIAEGTTMITIGDKWGTEAYFVGGEWLWSDEL